MNTHSGGLEAQNRSDLVSSKFRIREVLMRIQILGSVYRVTDPDTAFLAVALKKPIIKIFFGLFLHVIVGTLNQSSKIP